MNLVPIAWFGKIIEHCVDQCGLKHYSNIAIRLSFLPSFLSPLGPTAPGPRHPGGHTLPLHTLGSPELGYASIYREGWPRRPALSYYDYEMQDPSADPSRSLGAENSRVSAPHRCELFLPVKMKQRMYTESNVTLQITPPGDKSHSHLAPSQPPATPPSHRPQ
ncbi:hypothetical protein E2C01_034005 [Portunus trituberculatus]|uniref:Uncharacterized protein n=1 Tax=Portunus trituberculatus TaxID=210409 RepID=A0A5B7F5M6_PORTR|nr:hypothetical protein [Portunus trituberculatus]